MRMICNGMAQDGVGNRIALDRQGGMVLDIELNLLFLLV